MKYTVAWSLFAETQLADMWVRAANKQAITNASDEIDRLLRNDADNIGTQTRVGGGSLLCHHYLRHLKFVFKTDWQLFWPCVNVLKVKIRNG